MKKEYLNSDGTPFTIEQFRKKIRNDIECAKQYGDLGPVYGKQWRKWQAWMEYDIEGSNRRGFGSLWYDQISMALHTLKTNPDSRRIIVSAWNVGEIDKMKLPPCHYGFEFNTELLSYDEKIIWLSQQEGFDKASVNNETYIFEAMQHYNCPERRLSLMWHQRSVDTLLGLPFNIASYALLTHLFAEQCNMLVGDLICSLGDTHIYKNHLFSVDELLKRENLPLPQLKLAKKDSIFDYKFEDIEVINYVSHPSIKLPIAV